MSSQAASASRSSDFQILVIGAGFAGIAAAIRLKQAGIESFTILERASEIGGTWRDNQYPGSACDVPSHVYSLSFEQNPNWSRSYSSAPEIQQYLMDLVDKWNLRPHLRLETEVVSARLDEDAGSWTVTTESGESHTARVVISAVGGLVNPTAPKLPGLENFRGECFHTARWNHDVELAGQRVAVIGTGASAIQVVPSIAPEVAKLSVFQRTASWVMPRGDRAYSERAKERFARFPWLLRLSRLVRYWLSELFGPIVFLDSKRLSRLAAWASRRHLESAISDPALRDALTPDYQFGCKRVLISDDYWPAFARDNVELVTSSIDEIDADSIRTADGTRHPVDAIVLATGFALGLATAPFPVAGLRGQTLDKAWSGGGEAYKGMAVSGFPNWFVLMGPNTGPGHTSVLVFTEAQIEHAIQAIQKLRSEALKYLHVKAGVQRRYNVGIQGRMKHMSWMSGCTSWYLSEDGSNHSLYPGFAAEYVLRTRRFRASDYEIAVFD